MQSCSHVQEGIILSRSVFVVWDEMRFLCTGEVEAGERKEQNKL
jgi:hypothetical protein